MWNMHCTDMRQGITWNQLSAQVPLMSHALLRRATFLGSSGDLPTPTVNLGPYE